MRFVAQALLESTLRRGKSLEQFLGRAVLNNEAAIRWLELRPTSDTIEVWEFVAPDLGDQERLNIYEFLGSEDGTLATKLSSPSEALAFSQVHLGAKPERWVNQFVAQDEYRDFVQSGRPAIWPAVGG